MRWWKRKSGESSLDREVRLHLELEAREEEEAGLSARDARFAAQRTFGNVALVKEEVRAMSPWILFEDLSKDLHHALRSIRRNAGFSAAAIVSLALGIGANTAIFSLIDALLLRSLPVKNPAELVQLMLVEMGRPGNSFGYPTVEALASLTDTFAGVGGFSRASFPINSKGAYERVSGAWVTGGYYKTLGLEPFAGRLLTPEDDRPGAAPAAVLSYSFWETSFGRDFGVVGRTLQIDGTPVAIVGVSPPGFTGADVGDSAAVTLALGALPQLYPERARQLESGSQWLRVLARPRPGITVRQAKAKLAVAWPPMASIATSPGMNPKRRQVILNSTIDLVPGARGNSPMGNQFQKPLMVLMTITGLVLLIACGNFANLLLARGASRSKEIALRLAIGAGRRRIIRQLLTESLTLSSLGAVLGIALARVAGTVLVSLLPDRSPVTLDLRPDAGVLLFTCAVALATGILFGLAPAFRATSVGPGVALKAEAGITPRTRSRLLPALVVMQVALSLMLLIGAGLFIRTLENLENLNPGFRTDGVLVANLDARRSGFKGERLAALYQELLGQFQNLPGVISASVSDNTPLSGGIWSDSVSINGQPFTRESSHFNNVGPRYFETMGTALLQGRDFDARDEANAPHVALVSEAFVRRHLPAGQPLGQQLTLTNPKYPPVTIVGVVRDTVSQSLRAAPPPFVYLPYFQYPDMVASATFEIHAAGSLNRTAGLLRDELRAQFPTTPVQLEIEGLTDQVRRTLAQERMLAALGAGFGILALMLSSVGLYGLLAYTVARATNEIGIRMALGAQRNEVLRLIFGNALRLLAAGVALGLPAAWAATRLVASMLFGLKATDPLTIFGATLLLGATAVLAALAPALRASRVDPMVALRYE